jgi:SAM-dependent methyltransferase
VPYGPGSIPAGCDPYPAGVEWAEPDLDEAARLMRHVWDDRAEAEERGARARSFIEEERSPAQMAAFLGRRLSEIRSGPRPQRLGRSPLADGAAVAFGEVRQAFTRPRGEAATAARNGVGPALARARAWLERGPENSWKAPSRLGRPGVFFRRSLFRVLRPYAARQRELEVAVVEALEDLERLAGELEARRATDVSALAEQLAAAQAGLAGLQAELTAVPYMSEPGLLDRGGELGYGPESAGGRPDTYRGFEDVFRGSEDFIRERQRVYLDVLVGKQPVLDVGCGRGEMLELLAEAGIAARGIDIDEGMVARCREKGLEVERAEALEHLAGLKDGSLGAVFAAQVVEHLKYAQLMRFLELAHTKLAPGGVLVMETVNPHSVSAFKTFWVDLTHRSPIFPEVALAFCRLHGFAEARVLFPNGTGDLESDRVTQGEYAVVATRSV